MKQRFIIMLLVSFVLFTGCGSKSEGEKLEENTISYFDFTVSDFVDTLSEEYFTHLTFVTAVTKDDGTKTNTYTNGTPGDNSAPMVHYLVSYDKTTEKVTHISFFLNKEFETDISDLVLTHYFLHVGAVASAIEPNIDSGALMDEIADGFTENEFAVCNREKFSLHAFSGEYLDASFTAIEN